MWIARDKYGDLYMFAEKPVLWNNVWGPENWNPLSKNRNSEGFKHSMYLPSNLFPNAFSEVTFENSPVELKLDL